MSRPTRSSCQQKKKKKLMAAIIRTQFDTCFHPLNHWISTWEVLLSGVTVTENVIVAECHGHASLEPHDFLANIGEGDARIY
jgi:hypothetical protein